MEEVTDEQLIEYAINGMLSSLDPHSSYLTAKDFEEMQVQTKGEFGGLGIEVTMENGVIKVVSPIDETPASRAGLQPGDYIVQLDGEPVMGLNLSQAVDKMRGPVDSKIVLTVQRGERGAVRCHADPRRDQGAISPRPRSSRATSPICASPASPSKPAAAWKAPSRS